MRGDVLEAARLRPQIRDRREPQVAARTVVVPLPDGEEPLGLRVGKGTQEHRVRDAEDRRGGADADAENGRAGEREPRRAPQRPRRSRQVVQKSKHGEVSFALREATSREVRDREQRLAPEPEIGALGAVALDEIAEDGVAHAFVDEALGEPER